MSEAEIKQALADLEAHQARKAAVAERASKHQGLRYRMKRNADGGPQYERLS